MAESKVITFFSNGIGNFVMMMPALQSLSKLAGSKVDICLDDKWRDSRRDAIEEIIQKWDITGKIVNYPNDSINGNYTHWFYPRHNGHSDVTTLFSDKQTHPPIAKPNWAKTLIHEEDYYMNHIYLMGFKGVKSKVIFPLADNPILDLKRPIIGICNGAFKVDAKYWEKKRWPYFGHLADVLKLYFGGSVIGVGSKGELDEILCDENFAGRLSITESAKVISQCDLFITTDTGCMHIADMLDIPIIALFGATFVSKNAPRNKKSIVIKNRIECSPCQDNGRFWRCTVNECMEKITVSDVMNEVRRIMRVIKWMYDIF